MRIVAIIRRWIDVLATLFLAWREHRRERRSLIIRNENGQLVMQQGELNRDAIIRDVRSEPEPPRILTAGTAVPADVARAARDGFVILELPGDKFVTRRINVPAPAREFLPGVVRNQLERLSPWPTDQAAYGFDAEVNGEDAGILDVRVLIASRAVIDDTRDELAAIGLRVDRIVAREPDAQAAADKPANIVAIWSRLADASGESLEGVRRLIGVGIAAAIGTAVVLTLWALASASSIRNENEALAARSKVLQRQVQAGRTPASIASLPPAERAWVFKETSASSVIVIEVLSRALPDAAYLTEFRLEGATLRIIGLANDAPALLAPLEQSGHLTNVHFFAPTTRGPDGKLFRFHVEARVEPRTKIAEE
jgi:general secretion pathway protein L